MSRHSVYWWVRHPDFWILFSPEEDNLLPFNSNLHTELSPSPSPPPLNRRHHYHHHHQYRGGSSLTALLILPLQVWVSVQPALCSQCRSFCPGFLMASLSMTSYQVEFLDFLQPTIATFYMAMPSDLASAEYLWHDHQAVSSPSTRVGPVWQHFLVYHSKGGTQFTPALCSPCRSFLSRFSKGVHVHDVLWDWISWLSSTNHRYVLHGRAIWVGECRVPLPDH